MLEERYMNSSAERNKDRGEAQVSLLVADNMWTVFGLSVFSIYIFPRSLEGDIKLP